MIKTGILNEKNSEEIGPAEKFLFRQDELEENTLSWECGACGDYCVVTTSRYKKSFILSTFPIISSLREREKNQK